MFFLSAITKELGLRESWPGVPLMYSALWVVINRGDSELVYAVSCFRMWKAEVRRDKLHLSPNKYDFRSK